MSHENKKIVNFVHIFNLFHFIISFMKVHYPSNFEITTPSYFIYYTYQWNRKTLEMNFLETENSFLFFLYSGVRRYFMISSQVHYCESNKYIQATLPVVTIAISHLLYMSKPLHLYHFQNGCNSVPIESFDTIHVLE